MPAARYTTHTLYQRLLRQSRPYWAHIAGIFLLNLLSTPLVLLTPLPLKIAVDSVLGSQPLPRFLEVVLPVDVTRSDSAILVLTIGLVVAISLLVHITGARQLVAANLHGRKAGPGLSQPTFPPRPAPLAFLPRYTRDS